MCLQQDISFEKRDEFNRKPHTERIIKLLKSDIDLSPIVINGDWGTGKTEFCLKTLKLINSAHSGELNAVYFDAFSEDYIDQPLLSLLTVIYNAFPTEKLLMISFQVGQHYYVLQQKRVSISHLGLFWEMKLQIL